MKRAISLLAAVTLAFGLTGCFSKNKKGEENRQPDSTPAIVTPDSTSGQPAAQSEPAWKLRLTANCGEGSAESCVAAYGFTVLADGRYEVGPGPSGQMLSGKLEAEELKSIESLSIVSLGLAATAQVELAEVCGANTQGEANDQLDFVAKGGVEKNFVRTAGTEFCYRTASLEEADLALKAIRDLATKYYHLPFPDACLESAQAVEMLFAPLTTCSVDADCAYIDSSFSPIANGEIQFVVTDSCTVVKSLAVGNASSVAAEQGRLLAARENARDVCMDRMARPDCAPTGFQAHIAAPVCGAGVCQVNSASLAF